MKAIPLIFLRAWSARKTHSADSSQFKIEISLFGAKNFVSQFDEQIFNFFLVTDVTKSSKVCSRYSETKGKCFEIAVICPPDNSFSRQSIQMLRPCRARIFDWTSGLLFDLRGRQMSWRMRWSESGKVEACQKFNKILTAFTSSLSDPVVFLGYDPKWRGLRQVKRQIIFYLKILSLIPTNVKTSKGK